MLLQYVLTWAHNEKYRDMLRGNCLFVSLLQLIYRYDLVTGLVIASFVSDILKVGSVSHVVFRLNIQCLP